MRYHKERTPIDPEGTTLNVNEYITGSYGGSYCQGQIKIHNDYDMFIFDDGDKLLCIHDNVTNVVHQFDSDGIYLGTESLDETIIQEAKSKKSTSPKASKGTKTGKTKT